MNIDAVRAAVGLPPAVTDTSDVSRNRNGVATGSSAEQTAAAASQGQISGDALQGAVAQANQAAAELNQDLSFSIDPETKAIVLKVIDEQNNEVVFQVPSREALQLSSSLKDLSGIILDHKA